jgi:hypothetical protein
VAERGRNPKEEGGGNSRPLPPLGTSILQQGDPLHLRRTTRAEARNAACARGASDVRHIDGPHPLPPLRGETPVRLVFRGGEGEESQGGKGAAEPPPFLLGRTSIPPALRRLHDLQLRRSRRPQPVVALAPTLSLPRPSGTRVIQETFGRGREVPPGPQPPAPQLVDSIEGRAGPRRGG